MLKCVVIYISLLSRHLNYYYPLWSLSVADTVTFQDTMHLDYSTREPRAAEARSRMQLHVKVVGCSCM